MVKVEKVKATFRDELSTIDSRGKRKWIYPRKPSGKFWIWRNVVGFVLLAFFFGAPFIKVHGEPLILINFFERKFIILGVLFWPQDSYIFFLATVVLIVFIILFTVIYGRIFCGWVCPQTLFMELIFRRIEYWIDGDFQQQKKLKQQKWNAEKIFKRFIKYLIFYLISIYVMLTFGAYLVGVDNIKNFLNEGISSHPGGYFALFIFSTLFFLVYSWFREQVCTLICPYGRMQGVLLDPKSIVISYDYKRGEPRAPYKKNENRKEAHKGDCVNCLACVQVCPTGIDIRNGLQLECINCANCIDACNATMKRLNMPAGLIRYASAESIEKGEKFRFTPRMLAYSVVLILLLGLLSAFLIKRTAIETSILRTPGHLYYELDSSHYRNLYNLRIINKTRNAVPFEIKLLSHEGKITLLSANPVVEPENKWESVMLVDMDKSLLNPGKTALVFGVYSNGVLLQKIKTWFLIPE